MIISLLHCHTLSNQQLQSLLNKKSESENGLNEKNTITLNIFLHSERTAYLQRINALRIKQMAIAP